MTLENTMVMVQTNLGRLFIPTYPDEYLERWGRFYTDHEFLRLIRFEKFLKRPIFWIKCLGESDGLET